MSGPLAWLACIADAQPVDNYTRYLCEAGYRVEREEPHDEALLEMVNQVRMKLLGAVIMVGLRKLELPAVDFAAGKEMARSALSAVRNEPFDTDDRILRIHGAGSCSPLSNQHAAIGQKSDDRWREVPPQRVGD